MDTIIDSITEILSTVFGTIFDWVFGFISSFIFQSEKIESQGEFLIERISSFFSSLSFENIITFYFGFIWVVFGFKIAFKALSIVRG